MRAVSPVGDKFNGEEACCLWNVPPKKFEDGSLSFAGEPSVRIEEMDRWLTDAGDV